MNEVATIEENQAESIQTIPVAQLLTEIADLKARVTELEKYAHVSHSIGTDVINEVALAVIQKINEQLVPCVAVAASS